MTSGQMKQIALKAPAVMRQLNRCTIMIIDITSSLNKASSHFIVQVCVCLCECTKDWKSRQ